MKYMLLIYGNEELWSSFPPEVFEEVVRDTNALQAELRKTGEFVGAWGVGDQIVRVRAEARERKGWMFDTYLLRRDVPGDG